MPFNAVFSHIIKKRIPRINRFSEDPISCQKENLTFLLSTAAHTTFGRQYDYDKIRSVKSFQSNVPLSNYDSLKPYIERQLHGEVNVLWPGKQAGLQNLQEQALIRRNYYLLLSIRYMKIMLRKICLRFTIKISQPKAIQCQTFNHRW